MPAPHTNSDGDANLEWIRSRLQACGISADIPGGIEVDRSLQTNSGHVHFIQANTDPDSSPRLMVLKVYERDFLDFGMNEILFYRHFCADSSLAPAPAFYGSYANAKDGFCHILTADLTPNHEICDRRRLGEQYSPIVRALAELHARWWEHEMLSRDFMLIPQSGSVSMIQATTRPDIERAALSLLDDLIPKFCDQHGDHLPAGWMNLMEAAAGTWPDLFGDRIAGRHHLTLLHGDANWENIFLSRAPGGNARFVDWECFKCGPSAYDVAYLLVSARNVEQRREIESEVLRYYFDSLCAAGVAGYSYDDLIADYRVSLIANVFVAIAWRRLQAVFDAMTAFLDWECPALVC